MKEKEKYDYFETFIPGYYIKNDNEINLNLYDKDSSDCYYYYKINNNNKIGYVKITKDKDKYFMKVVYNYAKIEAYVDKDNLTKSVEDMSYILSSVFCLF